uniref:Pancreatic progenitor cell differentiation and proliferation factor n=1 Tax=Corvus moneduloides TaxID=1196302 RepID=A0A8U7N9U4_CORMO
MASIPSSGSLMATHNYRRRRLSSTSSTSSCSSEYSGEVIPHGPDLPKSDPGQWWASFFFGKTTHPAMTTVSESQESLGALRVASSVATRLCSLNHSVCMAVSPSCSLARWSPARKHGTGLSFSSLMHSVGGPTAKGRRCFPELGTTCPRFSSPFWPLRSRSSRDSCSVLP